MPDREVTARMYSKEYAAFSDDIEQMPDHRTDEAIAALGALGTPGRLVDYGCGGGDVLRAATALGWDCVGVEFDAAVAADLSKQLGVPVVTEDRALPELRGSADALMLNDVIEHLGDLEERFPDILEILRPGGTLLAQGPLEANPNLFMHVVAAQRRLGRRKASTMAPYHVLLATARGQREFFVRFGLREREFRLSEVAWPAPARLTRSVATSPRAAALWGIRRASTAIGSLVSRYSGNRYFYVGTRA